MQLYFRCLVTMLIPPLQVKDSEVKKTFSSDQPSSRRTLTLPEPVLNLTADPTRLSKTYALPMGTTGLNAITPTRLQHSPAIGGHLTTKKNEVKGVPNSCPLHLFRLVFYVVGNVSCFAVVERKGNERWIQRD